MSCSVTVSQRCQPAATPCMAGPRRSGRIDGVKRSKTTATGSMSPAVSSSPLSPLSLILLLSFAVRRYSTWQIAGARFFRHASSIVHHVSFVSRIERRRLSISRARSQTTVAKLAELAAETRRGDAESPFKRPASQSTGTQLRIEVEEEHGLVPVQTPPSFRSSENPSLDNGLALNRPQDKHRTDHHTCIAAE